MNVSQHFQWHHFTHSSTRTVANLFLIYLTNKRPNWTWCFRLSNEVTLLRISNQISLLFSTLLREHNKMTKTWQEKFSFLCRTFTEIKVQIISKLRSQTVKISLWVGMWWRCLCLRNPGHPLTSHCPRTKAILIDGSGSIKTSRWLV